jgi:LytR cell envelope-related transcriptional attenuator
VCRVHAATVVPSSPSQVNVAVLNGSDIAGLGRRVGNDLASHGFLVVRVEADALRPSEVAVLRYGPSAVGKATLLNAYLRDRGAMQFDIGRVDDIVEMVVGRSYEGLIAPAQRPPWPSPPTGTCA